MNGKDISGQSGPEHYEPEDETSVGPWVVVARTAEGNVVPIDIVDSWDEALVKREETLGLRLFSSQDVVIDDDGRVHGPTGTYERVTEARVMSLLMMLLLGPEFTWAAMCLFATSDHRRTISFGDTAEATAAFTNYAYENGIDLPWLNARDSS